MMNDAAKPAVRCETRHRAHAREAGLADGHDALLGGLAPWKRRLIESLRQIPNVDLACRKANCSRASAYRHRGDDEIFAQLWDEALEGAWDNAEGALYEEGVLGRERVTVQTRKDGTTCTTTERVRDVRAAEILLKGNRPGRYRERYEVHASVGFESAETAVLRAVQSGLLSSLAVKLAQRFGAVREAETVPAQPVAVLPVYQQA